MNNAIEIRGLVKRFKNLTAVDDVVLNVREGEFLSLLGVNGAGKTTLIRMLCGITKPDAGDALLLGRSIVESPRAAKAVVGVSPQESAVAPKLTVRENLRLVAQIGGLKGRAANARADEMIELLRLEENVSKYAEKLSGGMQRRLSIAMALATNPRILFLDEPTLGLDVLARRGLWEVLRGLHGRMTILMTTHYLEEAEALSDRIAVLRRGSLRALGTADELKRMVDAETFEDAFIRLAGEEDAACV